VWKDRWQLGKIKIDDGGGSRARRSYCLIDWAENPRKEVLWVGIRDSKLVRRACRRSNLVHYSEFPTEQDRRASRSLYAVCSPTRLSIFVKIELLALFILARKGLLTDGPL
jgi:hypothetical protein